MMVPQKVLEQNQTSFLPSLKRRSNRNYKLQQQTNKQTQQINTDIVTAATRRRHANQVTRRYLGYNLGLSRAEAP